MSQSHYKLLGVAEAADASEIRAAYRRQMRTNHPDLVTGSHEKASALNDAYAVLSDPNERAAYDAKLRRAREAGMQRPVRKYPVVPPRPRNSVLDEPEPFYLRPPSILWLILIFFVLNFVFVASIVLRKL